MSLALTEEQELLQHTVREFVQEKVPVKAFRSLRDGNETDGFDRKLWAEMCELGWASVPFSKDVGGAGLGYAELGSVLEELGRTLAATPLFATVVLGGSAVELAGNDAQRKEILTEVCAGNRLLALAFQETPRFDPSVIETRADIDGGGYRLTGGKIFVLDGHVADTIVVSARIPNGEVGLFLVDSRATGLEVARTIMVDSRNAANLTFDATPAEALGDPSGGATVLERVLDRGAIALSAEMLGGIQESFDRTLQYLKDREQFGAKIGSFQALKHRAADWFCEVELARSIVLKALRAVDADSADLATLASAAKGRASDVYIHSGEEGVQLHGGIGMTDEEDIGLYLKRARVAELTLGDGGYHRDRFALLQGY